MIKNPEASLLKCIRSRCNSKSDKRYNRYGGRGIECDWTISTFRIFLKECGWEKGMPIHRLDNDCNYNSDNCVVLPKRLHDNLHIYGCSSGRFQNGNKRTGGYI